MKTKIFIIAVLAFAFVACTKQKPQENTQQEVVPVVINVDTPSIEHIDIVEPTPVTPTKPNPIQSITTHSTSNTLSSTYNCDDYDDDDYEKDYYDNLRSHSPNDNYLLGFDEDIDDIHDMEIYIEDY